MLASWRRAQLSASSSRLIAHLLTEGFAPAPVAGLLLLIVAWHSAASLADALLWGVISVVCAAVIPMAYILRGVRRRRLTDRHVHLRQQRPLPLLVGVTSVLAGIALLTFGHAPRELVALVVAMGVGLSSSLLVTLRWKISIHVAVVAGAVVILILVFGPTWLVLAPLVVAVGWARVILGDHTPAQSAAGCILGATVAAAMFIALR
ncbi:MAG: phosphoesterase PA-phosphatase [Chloroflexota bacterium]|nr:phosphoesterase PA-phosphatase [Chloroflexota bacterium]